MDGSVYVVGLEDEVDETSQVVKVDVARRQTVQLGRRLQALVEVTGGIESGDQLVLTNLDIVEDGTKVFIQSSTTALDEIKSSRNSVRRLAASDSQ